MADVVAALRKLLSDPEKRLVAVPVLIAAAVITAGVVVAGNDIGVIGNLALMSVLLVTVPFSVHKYLEVVRIRSLEEEFPDFLRDLAENERSGMTLMQALDSCKKTNYGRLSPEIALISNQLSWGVSFERAVRMFIKRTHKSELVSRSMKIVLEAYLSGGGIAPTLESIAADAATIRESYKEQRAVMSEHVMMMYAIFFMFVVIIIALSKIMVPMFKEHTLSGTAGGIGGFGFRDPCENCAGGEATPVCIPCGTYGVMCKMFGLGTTISCYYNAMFFAMIVIQGVFNGLVAGQVGENSATSGLKHSLIMAGSGFAIFTILVRLHFIGG